jgi:Icc-related predicted phosphoesterase
VRILAVADSVSPFIYSDRFPDNLPPFDLVLSAGDMPGHVLEFMATKLSVPPVYVLGNHGNGFVRDPVTDEISLPGGCVNAHRRVVEVGGLLIAGVEGSARYRPGSQQYTEIEMRMHCAALAPRFAWNRMRRGRAVDILLTHAAPKGPHEGTDYPHRGVAAFNRLAERWKPRLHVHGHVHLSGANAPREYVTEGGVRVINAFEFTLIEFDDRRLASRSVGSG